VRARVFDFLHSVGDGADAVDLARHHVPILEPERRFAEATDTRGGARENDITGLQGDDGRDPSHRLRGVEDQLARVGVLHRLAVEHAADAEVVGVDVSGISDARADGREGLERLAQKPLASIALDLPITSTHVVCDGVACNVRGGIFDRDEPPLLTNDDGQLDFEIQFLDERREFNGVAGIDDATWQL